MGELRRLQGDQRRHQGSIEDIGGIEKTLGMEKREDVGRMRHQGVDIRKQRGKLMGHWGDGEDIRK